MVPSQGATEKIPSDTTGNRSRDRPTISAVSEPLRHPRPHLKLQIRIIYVRLWSGEMVVVASLIQAIGLIFIILTLVTLIY